MSRYLPLRVYDYYAPGKLCSLFVRNCFKFDPFVLSILILLSFSIERFNETIFDYIPTYLLNICEVCGSSQCPYCSIYNAAVKSPVPLILIISMSFVLLIRHIRTVRPNSSWLLLVISWFDWSNRISTSKQKQTNK